MFNERRFLYAKNVAFLIKSIYPDGVKVLNPQPIKLHGASAIAMAAQQIRRMELAYPWRARPDLILWMSSGRRPR